MPNEYFPRLLPAFPKYVYLRGFAYTVLLESGPHIHNVCSATFSSIHTFKEKSEIGSRVVFTPNFLHSPEYLNTLQEN